MLFACNIAVEKLGGGDSEFGWGEWVGGGWWWKDTVGQLSSALGEVQSSGPEDIFSCCSEDCTGRCKAQA